jgi:hypothetical protein
LTCLLGSLLVPLSITTGVQEACAAGADPAATQKVVKVQTTSLKEAQLRPFKVDDGWFFRKMLSPQRLRNLKLGSDLEGLAERGVSQPEEPVG